MAHDADVVLEAVDLQIEFATRAGTVRAVDGVSFSVRRGRTLAVVGESGSGKSTTALGVTGLLPRPAGRIAGGEVRFEGQVRCDGEAPRRVPHARRQRGR